ncbi:MAG: VOC family protein [Alicyclobacillus sp.]|nr:VOC family protein [Alicyclobacillus sp.]
MNASGVTLKTITPILRIFDEAKAKEFYLDFLDFQLDWEHRFEADAPLYMQVSQGECVLHLSEHHGDACPGSTIRIETDGIESLHAVLSAKQYKYYHPGLQETPWNTREVCVQDPFGNRIVFFSRISRS